MPIDDDRAAGRREGGEGRRPEDGRRTREKVIVRSNGTVTYVGKDMAYQFWKSGLLGQDFHYRKFATRWTAACSGPRPATDAAPGDAGHPRFGARRDLQRHRRAPVVSAEAAEAGAGRDGASGGGGRSTHFSYEMVALSHATARELGFAPGSDSEDAKKPFVEVSGRKGLGVKADDLIDRVIEKALVEVERRNPSSATPERRGSRKTIGVAAVRYFLVKFSRGKVIAFDIDEALSFEGESGPYLQYAVVRANNIFQKLQEREGPRRKRCWLRTAVHAARSAERRRPGMMGLVLEAARLDEIVEQVCGRWSSRCWRNTRSGSRRCSTRSTIARRSSTKSARTSGAGGRRRWPISGSS